MRGVNIVEEEVPHDGAVLVELLGFLEDEVLGEAPGLPDGGLDLPPLPEGEGGALDSRLLNELLELVEFKVGVI